MAKMLIAYYSRSGHTQHMAEAIGKGASEVDGVDVEIRPVGELTAKDLLDYDAIVLGSPTYYGSMAWEIKKLLDESVEFHGQLEGKVGGAFTSAANIGGGNETAACDLLHALLIHGMIVQGVVRGDHYGPVAINDVDERSTRQCGHYGTMLAVLTARLAG